MCHALLREPVNNISRQSFQSFQSLQSTKDFRVETWLCVHAIMCDWVIFTLIHHKQRFNNSSVVLFSACFCCLTPWWKSLKDVGWGAASWFLEQKKLFPQELRSEISIDTLTSVSCSCLQVLLTTGFCCATRGDFFFSYKSTNEVNAAFMGFFFFKVDVWSQ